MSLHNFDLTLTEASVEDVSYEGCRMRRERKLGGLFVTYVTDHPVWGSGQLFRRAFVTFYNIERTISFGPAGSVFLVPKAPYTTPVKKDYSWNDNVFVKIF